MKARYDFVMQLLCFAALALLANPAFALLHNINSNGDPYPVLHSAYSAEDQGSTYRLSWIDNDRILFSGEPKAEILARFDKNGKVIPGKRGNRRFYIWNTRTNEVQIYKETVDRVRFCYNESENWIRYPSPGKKNAVMEGKLGEEREMEIDPVEHSPAGRVKRGVFFHELTCREHPYAPSNSGVAERRIFPLLLDHGTLDVWGNQIDARPIRLFSNDYRKVAALPLPRAAVAPSKIHFSKYKQAYVLTGFTAPPSFSNPWGTWPKHVNQPVYLLSKDGKLSLGGEIPWYEGYREALGAYFTVQGLVYAGGREPNEKGFFLVRDGKRIRLLKAIGPLSIRAGGVSPDGCKIAAALSMDGANESGGLKVIDLCKREKK